MSYDEGWRDRGELAEKQTAALHAIARALEHAGVKLPLAYEPANLAALVADRVILRDGELARARGAGHKEGKREGRASVLREVGETLTAMGYGLKERAEYDL